MKEAIDQPKTPVQERGLSLPEQGGQHRTHAEEEAGVEKKNNAHDARELSRADTTSGIGLAEATIRTLQAEKIFNGKCPDGFAADKIAKAFEVVSKTLRKTLGMAGIVAVMSGAFELSKLTNLSAQAATLEKSPTAVESVNTHSFDVLRDSTASGRDTQEALDSLRKSAKEHPQEFVAFLEGSYRSYDQEMHDTPDGRTLSMDWALPKADMMRALQDKTFSGNNSLELMQPLVDKSHDVKLGFSEKDQILLKEYPSQAYSDKPHQENGRILRRDVLFSTNMSGNDYSMRGIMRYDNKGMPYSLLVDAQLKNSNLLKSDGINNASDERIALLAGEFQNEFVRYQKGELGSRTLSDYAKPGRELVSQIQVMKELEKRGLNDEAHVVARQIAEGVHRIESGGIVAQGEGQGKGFFDYSKFPSLVQRELAQELPSFDQLKQVVNTRGSVVLHQLEQDITTEVQSRMTGIEKK